MARELFDQAIIYVRSGSGGNGAATFRREKYVPRGGPDGGNGGRGGNVYLLADMRENTLLAFRDQTRFAAQDGGHGTTRKRYGHSGDDVTIRVPPGTVVRTTIDGVDYEIDLQRPGQCLLAARGGRGGLGNIHFATSARQAPRIAELGEPGEELRLDLELKLIADVGLVGFPNAGKSTLLSVISAARPKIAPYPFTTLQPNLGVVEVGPERFVVADIPGLIEDAHQNVGLGCDFLRHIERTRLLLHLVDAAGVDGREPLDDYHQINKELFAYNPDLAQRPQIVVLNKMDLPDAQAHADELRAVIVGRVGEDNVLAIAAATHQGVEPLLYRMAERLRALPAPDTSAADADEPLLTWPRPEVDPNRFEIEYDDDVGWRVRGVKIERLIKMTNFDQPEALDRVQRVLQASGISAALEEAGVQEGDVVTIANAELIWSEVETYG